MKKLRVMLALGLLCSGHNLLAAEKGIWCDGHLSNVYVNTAGELTIRGSWHPGWTAICNTKNPGSVDVVTCSLWASYAATAVKDKLPVTLHYMSTVYECNTLPSYGDSPTPFYFMLKAS